VFAAAAAAAAAVAAAAAAAPAPAVAAAAAAPVVAVFASSADTPLQQDAWLLQEYLLQQAGDGWIPILPGSGQPRRIATSFGNFSPAALNVPAQVIRKLLPLGNKLLVLRAVRLVARPGDDAALAAVAALQAELAGTHTASLKLRWNKNKDGGEHRIHMPKTAPLCGALVALRHGGCGLTRMRWGAGPHELEIEVARMGWFT
jgi:hypothetical protein